MILIQIAITAAIIHVVAAKQLDAVVRKMAEVAVRVRFGGDSSAVAELPSKPLAVFLSLVVVGSYWTAIVAGLAGAWSL
jgi:hypothetical protein